MSYFYRFVKFAKAMFTTSLKNICPCSNNLLQKIGLVGILIQVAKSLERAKMITYRLEANSISHFRNKYAKITSRFPLT